MFRRYQLVLLILWIIRAEKVSLQSNGSRKLDLHFDNVTFMDMQSRVALTSMHDDLDTDEDGNVSINEGKVFFANQKDMLKNPQGKSNLPGFATDVDGRITEQEFWSSWIESDVHNWTNAEMLAWLKYDVELPQYISNFHALNISGAAFPILAYNGSIVSALADGSKENKLKLMLKAKEIVLFGPSKQKANLVKDALLTISLLLALSGIFFGVHVQRNANLTIKSIQEKMRALQNSMDTMEVEAEGEIDKLWSRDISRQDDEHSRGSNSGESEDSAASILLSDETMASNKLAQVMRELDATREALRNAEKQMQRKSYQLPDGLLECLQTTYQVETKLFEMKKKKVYKDIEQTKVQFQKIERNRSTFLGILQVVHSRQMDSFDFEVQQTRDEFRELQAIVKERRKRWTMIEHLCKMKIKTSSRSSATLPRSKMTPEEEIISNLESMSITSCSSNAERSLLLKQRSKGKNRRPSITSTSVDEEERDAVSLKSYNSHGRKSPVASKKRNNFPSHLSSPTLSQMNGYEKEKTDTKQLSQEKMDTKQLSHSGSASLLQSRLSIPEGGNQTFPKRSPMNKKRSKIPEWGSTPGSPNESPTEPLGSNPGDNNNTHHKSKSYALAPVKPVATSNGLNSTKRSPSIQSLPVQRKKDGLGLDSPDSPSPIKSNGDVKTLVPKKLESCPANGEKPRKSNLFKGKFFKKKISKDKK